MLLLISCLLVLSVFLVYQNIKTANKNEAILQNRIFHLHHEIEIQRDVICDLNRQLMIYDSQSSDMIDSLLNP
ncbi:MAG: hypothetical protein ABJA76_09510 [Mucilaginibacter sp.]